MVFAVEDVGVNVGVDEGMLLVVTEAAREDSLFVLTDDETGVVVLFPLMMMKGGCFRGRGRSGRR